MNLTAEQARAQLVLIGGRLQSAQGTLHALMHQEPKLTAFLDILMRDLRQASWDVREAGENVEVLYSRVWGQIAVAPPTGDLVRGMELPVRRTWRWRREGE